MSSSTSTLVKFWNDDKTEIHPSRLRKDIPEMPKVSKDLQVVKGGAETLGYLALQVKKSVSKQVIVRAIASAVMILFEDSKNYTGSATVPEDLTGLDVIIDEDITERDVNIVTNFKDAETVKISEMDEMMEIDPDELGAYFGVLCLAAVKSINKDNRAAFNERRQGAVSATTIGDRKIFVSDSPLLADAVIQKVYASFNSYLPIRSHVISNAVAKLDRTHMGPTLSFATMFLLLVDQGMSALRIVKEALVRHTWIVEEFPDLKPEINAAQEGLNSINKGRPSERSFLKSIYGAQYVPVSYTAIQNLTGVCKFVLKETTKSYEHYDGGLVTANQERKLTQLMIAKGLMVPISDTAITQE